MDENDSPVLAADIRYLVLKAPNLTFSFKNIANLRIPTVVVYLVRDPRSVVASMMKLQHIPMVANQLKLIADHPELAEEFASEIALITDRASSSILKRALVWRIKSSLQDRFAEQGIPTLTLKYEDLIADTERVCKAIAAHMQIPFDSQMLAHDEVFQGVAQGRTNRARPIDGHSIGAWKEKLTETEERQIITIALETMVALGYQLSDEQVLEN